MDPDSFILQAADLACGPDRVTLFPSADGSRVAVFVSDRNHEQVVSNGPFLGREASVYFRRHDETDQRFLFDHEAMAALSISYFPFEHWQRHHITHSSGPYANPHNIDPICLTGVDFHAVLITVKAESISDIPLNLAVKITAASAPLAASPSSSLTISRRVRTTPPGQTLAISLTLLPPVEKMRS
jgi:hypothetical protein